MIPVMEEKVRMSAGKHIKAIDLPFSELHSCCNRYLSIIENPGLQRTIILPHMTVLLNGIALWRGTVSPQNSVWGSTSHNRN